MAIYGNQTLSERLKTPVSRIKKLRYDAALKFGGRIEDQAMGRLLAALSKASLESDGDKNMLNHRRLPSEELASRSVENQSTNI